MQGLFKKKYKNGFFVFTSYYFLNGHYAQSSNAGGDDK